jgi:hypothetical protein
MVINLTEDWKDVQDYEELYKVSNLGNVYSVKSQKILKAQFSYDGHAIVGLYKNRKFKSHSIHRLVANAFIPNPMNLPIVHHLDNNPRNNCVDNLKWCTQKENVHHTIAAGNHGTMGRRK